MAYRCVRGRGECDGCMDCEPPCCDECGAPVEDCDCEETKKGAAK